MCIRQIDLNARLGSVRRKRITIVSQFRRVFAIAITKTKKTKPQHTTARRQKENITLSLAHSLARSHIAALASNENFPAYTTRITRSDYRSRFRRILVLIAHTFLHNAQYASRAVHGKWSKSNRDARKVCHTIINGNEWNSNWRRRSALVTAVPYRPSIFTQINSHHSKSRCVSPVMIWTRWWWYRARLFVYYLWNLVSGRCVLLALAGALPFKEISIKNESWNTFSMPTDSRTMNLAFFPMCQWSFSIDDLFLIERLLSEFQCDRKRAANTQHCWTSWKCAAKVL